MRPIDADACPELFDAEFKKTKRLILAGEKHLDNLAEGFMEANNVISLMPTIAPPPNDPLTLEELREMDGEPVWNDTIKKYALVDAGWLDGIGRTINSNGKYRLLDDRYYRRKPEEWA